MKDRVRHIAISGIERDYPEFVIDTSGISSHAFECLVSEREKLIETYEHIDVISQDCKLYESTASVLKEQKDALAEILSEHNKVNKAFIEKAVSWGYHCAIGLESEDQAISSFEYKLP